LGRADKASTTGERHTAKADLHSYYLTKKTGFKPSVFTDEEKAEPGTLASNPKNGIAGYVELQRRVNKKFDKDLKYIILIKFMQHNFKTKIKVARKSHINKDATAVETF